MMRVEFFCNDKDLAKVHWVLEGLALEHPKCTPVRNAVVKPDKSTNGTGKKIKAKVKGTVTEATQAKIVTMEVGTELRFKDIQQICTAVGGSKSSGYYTLQKLIDNGIISKKRQDGTYLTLAPKK